MTPAQILHTFARRTCIDRFSFWIAEYEPLVLSGQDRDGYYYTDEACNIFPRYNVLRSTLMEIEKIDFDKLPDLPTLFEVLANVGQLGNVELGRERQTLIASEARADELQKFRDTIASFDPTSEESIEPLFYRRVLSESEDERFWEKLDQHWGRGSTEYWYPMSDKTHPTLTFRSLEDVDYEIMISRIEKFLSTLKTSRIFELRENGESFEQEKDGIEFFYNGAEGYWFDNSMAWVVYCSHENTITMGGVIAHVLDGFPQTIW